jgi:hypothetical protein
MLALMAQEPDLRHGMGAMGRALILREFENDRVVDTWEALFRQWTPGRLVPAGPLAPTP